MTITTVVRFEIMIIMMMLMVIRDMTHINAFICEIGLGIRPAIFKIYIRH